MCDVPHILPRRVRSTLRGDEASTSVHFRRFKLGWVTVPLPNQSLETRRCGCDRMRGLLRATLLLFGWTQLAPAQSLDYSRDVLPILSDRCFQCHGPDEADREAGLRLDQQADVADDRGIFAVVEPHHPEQSELIERIITDDPQLRMPPPDSHVKPLAEWEIETLKGWVASGAKWGEHWAFKKPTRSAVPYPRDASR